MTNKKVMGARGKRKISKSNYSKIKDILESLTWMNENDHFRDYILTTKSNLWDLCVLINDENNRRENKD